VAVVDHGHAARPHPVVLRWNPARTFVVEAVPVRHPGPADPRRQLELGEALQPAHGRLLVSWAHPQRLTGEGKQLEFARLAVSQAWRPDHSERPGLQDRWARRGNPDLAGRGSLVEAYVG